MSKYAFAMMTSLAVLMLSVEQAKAIVQPPKNPVHVGKAGNNQKAAKKVKGTTSPTGKITYDMKNTSGRAATDVHIEITSMTRGERHFLGHRVTRSAASEPRRSTMILRT